MGKRIHTIALSADIDLFKNERLLDANWAKQFPGALWVPVLAEKLRRRQFKVTTGDVALSHVKQGYWNAGEIGVIQHLNDPETEKLIALGAKPLVLTAFESPLYVPAFYDTVASIAPKFSHRIMFHGLFDLFSNRHGLNHHVRFPTFNEGDLREIIPWSERRFLIMVVGNKYEVPFSPLYLRHPLDILRWIKRGLRSLKSKASLNAFISSNKFKGEQLQDKRLSAIIFFGKENCLRLYGKGWESLKNLPMYYRKQLTTLLNILKPQYSENKMETIKNFKFALCFENYSFPGYVTEKIVDCFVAGVIPVYLGAPDIEEFVPSDSFIDVRHYKDWASLLDRLKSITDIEAVGMINSGRRFLATREGQLHSFEGFASFIEGFILQECNSPSFLMQEEYSVVEAT
jgi:hypothetical protein